MSSFAVRVTQSLLARSLPTGYLKAAAPTSVTVRQNGVALVGATYSDNIKTALSNPVPLSVLPGAPGVSTRGELLVFLNPGRGYDASVVIGTSITIVPLPDVALDYTEPIPSAAITEAMLSFGVATQAELDTEAATRAAAVTSESTTRSAADATLTANVAANTTAIATKAADSSVVHNTGAETVAGVKTFSAAPVVPTAAFPESAVSGLVADLAGKQPTIPPGTYVVRAAAAGLHAFDALKVALTDTSRSTGYQVLGDSTGDGPTEWPYIFAQQIAPLYPAWTFHHRLWNDAAQQFSDASVLQTGTAGTRYLDGSSGATTRRMDPLASPHLSGVIDLTLKMSVADWTPVAGKTFFGKSGADPQRGWYAGIQASTGRPQFTFSTDGNAATLTTMTVLASPTVADGAIIHLRWVFTPDNGAAGRSLAAYQSPDGFTWTQIGSTITTAGAVVVYNNSTTGYELGGVASGIGDTSIKIYEVVLRNGLLGPPVAPCLPDLWPPYDISAATFVGAPVCTVVNGSRSGGDITYLGDSVRLPKMTPDYGQILTFLSDSHNEGKLSGAYWVGYYDAWRVNVEANVPGAPVCILTQNPESSGTPWYREHAKRRLDLLGYARQKRLNVIDTYQAFIDAGWPGALMLDDVHPNSAGSIVWRDAIKAVFDAA